MAMAMVFSAASLRHSLLPISRPPRSAHLSQSRLSARTPSLNIDRSLLFRTQSSSEPSSPQNDQELKQIPSWAQPGSSEPPPWERKQAVAEESTTEIPFFVYLLASGIVAIAAIGSIFEYTNKNPIFGVIFPDNALYAPILGFFAITGLPSAAFLWFKSIELANKAAREQDREDGYFD